MTDPLPKLPAFPMETLCDEVYLYEDEAGWQFHWNVTVGRRLAEARGDLGVISLREIGVTPDFLRSQYQGLDETYALASDLNRPLLFVPIGEKVRPVDGWHRLLKAALLGVDLLPAYFLTSEEADACLVCCLPPEYGVDWGQRSKEGADPPVP